VSMAQQLKDISWGATIHCWEKIMGVVQQGQMHGDFEGCCCSCNCMLAKRQPEWRE
jgi:hypothetical protein